MSALAFSRAHGPPQVDVVINIAEREARWPVFAGAFQAVAEAQRDVMPELARLGLSLSLAVTAEVARQREAEFSRLLAGAGESRDRRDFAGTARLVRQARALPGYERHQDALAAWSALYTCLPRTGLRAA